MANNRRWQDLMFDRLLPGLPVDYQALVARRSANGVWDVHESRVVPSAEQLCYFVPRPGASAPRLLFCVRGDGAVAFSDNEEDETSDGERGFRGYGFALVLPGKDGAPLGENARGGAAGSAIDADLAERHFCCYAWPLHAGRSGNRAFVVTAAGEVMACANADGRYSGGERRPALDAVITVRGRTDRDVDREPWGVIE
ncbi:MAG: hypothetical protein H6835_16250 [Planctomycetes bacterium]|nr:hypothetical protein [Planctomycetota bacterium]